MARTFETDHIWEALETWQPLTRQKFWEWCIIHGEVRKGTLTRLPLASLEPNRAPDIADPPELRPMPDNRSDSSVRAPIKATDDPDPATRRAQFLTRARFFYRDSKGKTYVPKQSELDLYADTLEHMYQTRQIAEAAPMECTCPWQWPKLITHIDDEPVTEFMVAHHLQCVAFPSSRLGTKQYFDDMQGNYHGQPRH